MDRSGRPMITQSDILSEGFTKFFYGASAVGRGSIVAGRFDIKGSGWGDLGIESSSGNLLPSEEEKAELRARAIWLANDA